MRGEDSHDRLMRLLHEHQAALIERVSRGALPNTNEAGGYIHTAGQVVGLDAAIDIVRRSLFGGPVIEGRESIADAYEV